MKQLNHKNVTRLLPLKTAATHALHGFLFCGTFLLCSAAEVQNKIPHGNAVLALVNNTPITFNDVWDIVGKRLESVQVSTQVSDQEFAKEMLRALTFTRNTLIRDHLILEKAKKENLAITDKHIEYWAEREIEYLNAQGANLTAVEDLWQYMAERTRLSTNRYKEKIKKQILVREYMKAYVWTPEYFSPETVRSYYQQHRDDFRRRGYITLRHILISRRIPNFTRIIEGIKNAIENGEDFKEIARKAVTNRYSYREGDDSAGRYRFSYGTGKAEPSREKACNGKIEEKLNELLREKVRELKEGEISEPIATFTGTHFFKVIEREPGKVSPFSEVQSRIQDVLQDQYQKELENRFIHTLLQKNSIKYFPFPKETPLGRLPEEIAAEAQQPEEKSSS